MHFKWLTFMAGHVKWRWSILIFKVDIGAEIDKRLCHFEFICWTENSLNTIFFPRIYTINLNQSEQFIYFCMHTSEEPTIHFPCLEHQCQLRAQRARLLLPHSLKNCRNWNRLHRIKQKRKHWKLRFFAAQIIGDTPSLSTIFGLAPCSSSIFTILEFALNAAQFKLDQPWSSLRLTLIPFFINILTISSLSVWCKDWELIRDQLCAPNEIVKTYSYEQQRF